MTTDNIAQFSWNMMRKMKNMDAMACLEKHKNSIRKKSTILLMKNKQ
jgi:hypothetical protein